MHISSKFLFNNKLILTRNPRVIWKEPRRHLSRQRMDSPAACAMPTALSRQYATSTSQYHIDARAFAKSCHKVPIGYNGMHHIYPQNCPFCFDDFHPSTTPIPRLTPLTIQTATRSNQPFFSQFIYQTDRQNLRHTGRQTDRPTHGL